jgi:hypothetical protein
LRIARVADWCLSRIGIQVRQLQSGVRKDLRTLFA